MADISNYYYVVIILLAGRQTGKQNEDVVMMRGFNATSLLCPLISLHSRHSQLQHQSTSSPPLLFPPDLLLTISPVSSNHAHLKPPSSLKLKPVLHTLILIQLPQLLAYKLTATTPIRSSQKITSYVIITSPFVQHVPCSRSVTCSRLTLLQSIEN